jgi:hypothetical protein
VEETNLSRPARDVEDPDAALAGVLVASGGPVPLPAVGVAAAEGQVGAAL